MDVLNVRIVHSFVLSACLLVSFALKLFFVEDMYVILWILLPQSECKLGRNNFTYIEPEITTLTKPPVVVNLKEDWHRHVNI